MKLLLLDGNSIFNRAFYGIKLLTTKEGVYTNAIYGFLTMLNKLKEETKPDTIIVAFDTPFKTFRHKIYEGYKAGRKGMPAELISQFPILKEILKSLGYCLVERNGFEADDILGTLSSICEKKEINCIIATGDRDLLQLVSNKITVRITSAKCGRPFVTLYDEQKIKEEYNLAPKQLIDIKALMGDTSDNIPGVVGIGKKNAITLVENFGTLENIYKNISSEKIKESVRKKLLEGRESAFMSYTLGEIKRDVDINQNIEDYAQKEMNYKKIKDIMTKLELFTILKKLENCSEFKENKNNCIKDDLNVVHEEDLTKITSELKKSRKADFIATYVNKKITMIAFVVKNQIKIVKDGPEFFEFLKNFLEDLSIKKSTHNVKNLFSFAEKYKIKIKGLVFDTLLASYLLNPSSKNYNLEDLAFEYAGFCVSEDKNFPRLERILVKHVKEFFNILKIMKKKIKEHSQTKLLEKIEIPVSKVLSIMEATGFFIDEDGIKKYSKTLSKDILQLQEEIFESVGYSFNIQSPKQLGTALFESLSLPHGNKQTKLGYSTDAQTLESLNISHPVSKKVLKYRTLCKIKSTYCDVLLKEVKKDGRVRTIFSQTETRTGRLSSSEPNLQNIPTKTKIGRNLRKFFCAKKDFVLIDADYSQIELRILAHIANDKEMIKSFELDKDIHAITASEIFGVPLEMVTEVMRNQAKSVNFGIIYGISAFSLSKDIGISVKEANDFIFRYLNHYSEIKHYLKEILSLAKEKGYVETLFGRRRYLPELASSNFNLRSFGERAAMNMPIQGTAADIIKIAMIQVNNRIEKEKVKAKLVLQVHDELIVESRISDVRKTLKIVEEEMESAVKLKVKLVVKSNFGKTWYEAKTKDQNSIIGIQN
ncbi:MAG: DNA polymerase I [Oscillospiraceae bacterium]|jgi:DNA polymerase-1|nr:DNA polymerase I [Oscillospiraceae bacterium]